MGYTVKGTMITLTRGDTLEQSVTVSGYELGSNDKLYFGMKKTYEGDCLVHKEIPTDTLQLRLDHSDTKDLDLGTYVWDIQLIMDDSTSEGYYDTIAKGKLKLTGEAYDVD